MTRNYTILLLFMISAMSLCAQTAYNADRGHFLFEPEAFSPPVQAMIQMFEGFPATPFIANDMKGVERYLGDYKGKKVLLTFLDANDYESQRHLSNLNALAGYFPKSELEIVAFANQDRTSLAQFMKHSPINFTIMPNGDIFGERVYAADLGKLRIFAIDSYGVIQKVIPQSAFEQTSDSFAMIEAVVKTLQ